MPSISSANAFAAGTVAQLPGLQRLNGAAFSDVFVYNLETKAASCTLRVFQSNGAPIGARSSTGTAVPKSQRSMTKLLSLSELSDQAR